mgnify:CR=1 FL=1
MSFPGYPYGFVSMEQETLARSKGESFPPDLKESFSIGPGLEPPPGLFADEAQFVFSKNQWPDNPIDFKRRWKFCYKSLSDCADRVLRLLSFALDLPENWFDRFFMKPISAMRVNYYPELSKEPLENQLRASAHSDYGSLTLLLQDEGESGLEILNRDNEWISVKPCKPDLVVNIGDLMELWTSNRWTSTLHRVVSKPNQPQRKSLAFFHQPDWDAEIKPIDEHSLSQPVRSGPYLMSKFLSTTEK